MIITQVSCRSPNPAFEEKSKSLLWLTANLAPEKFSAKPPPASLPLDLCQNQPDLALILKVPCRGNLPKISAPTEGTEIRAAATSPDSFLDHPQKCVQAAAHAEISYRNRRNLEWGHHPIKVPPCETESWDKYFRVQWRHNKETQATFSQISDRLKQRYVLQNLERFPKWKAGFEKGHFLSSDNARLYLPVNTEATKPSICANPDDRLCDILEARNIEPAFSFFYLIQQFLKNAELALISEKNLPWDSFPISEKESFELSLQGDKLLKWDKTLSTTAVPWPAAAYFTPFAPYHRAALDHHFPTMKLPADLCSNVPLPFVFAHMRQESAFNPKAISSAGALGLMQIMPTLVPKNQNPFDPETNIRIGCNHLGQLYQDYGNPWIAAAIYNAGPTLLPQLKIDPLKTGWDFVAWLESIPYTETRNYVRAIFRNATFYYYLLEDRTQFPTHWMSLKNTKIEEFFLTSERR